jgi:hypothetical protein
MTSFQLINTMKENGTSPKSAIVPPEVISEDNFPQLLLAGPLSSSATTAPVSIPKPAQNLEQMIAKKQVLAELEKAEDIKKNKTVNLEPSIEDPPTNAYKQVGLDTDRTTSEIRRRGSINILGQINHSRRPSGPISLPSATPNTPTTPRPGAMAITSLRDPLPTITDNGVERVDSTRSFVETAIQRRESEGPSPAFDKVRQSVTAKLKFMLKRTIQDPQTPKDSDRISSDSPPKVDWLYRAESKVSGKDPRKTSGDNELGKEPSGALRLKDGGVYEGQIEKGCMHGLGTLILSDGSIYKGRFFKNLFHGSGELSRPGQVVLSGYFVPMNETGSQYKVTQANGEVVSLEI